MNNLEIEAGVNINTSHLNFTQWWTVPVTVNQYTKKWEYIKTWDKMKDAEKELKIAHSSISQCCREKRPSAWWYVWRYNKKIK